MKAWKKNLVAAAVLVTVCAGIYVNWLYTEQTNVASLSDTLDYEKVMSEDGLLLTDDVAAITEGEEVSTTASDYFAAVRLSRQQARDNAFNMLQEVMTYSETDKAAESAVDLEDIVQTALSEAQIESLIIAKGYQDLHDLRRNFCGRFSARWRPEVGGCCSDCRCGDGTVKLWPEGHPRG